MLERDAQQGYTGAAEPVGPALSEVLAGRNSEGVGSTQGGLATILHAPSFKGAFF